MGMTDDRMKNERRKDDIMDFIIECGIAFNQCLGRDEAVRYLDSKKVSSETIRRVLTGHVRSIENDKLRGP